MVLAREGIDEERDDETMNDVRRSNNQRSVRAKREYLPSARQACGEGDTSISPSADRNNWRGRKHRGL